MNVRRLRIIRDLILANPSHFDMSSWFWRSDFQPIPDKPKLSGDCGTTACIAGWAVVKWGSARTPTVQLDAARILGLPVRPLVYPDEPDRLFHLDNWPDNFRTRYYTARSAKARARAAADRINHFIVTKGAE